MSLLSPYRAGGIDRIRGVGSEAERKLPITTRYVSEGPAKLSLAYASGWDPAICRSPYYLTQFCAELVTRSISSFPFHFLIAE